MSEESEPNFYLTSREVNESDRAHARRFGYGIFGKYDEEARSVVVEKLRGKNVYFVDDESGFFDFIPNELRQGGAIVTVFDSAEAALKAMREQRPDVVVSDITLGPGLSGWQFAMAWDKLASTN